MLRAAMIAFVTIAIIFLLLVLSVRLIVVPNIGSFRNDITAQIAKGIGRDVTIGGIDAGWDGWSPTLSLSELKLFDGGGREVLALPRIETSVSWQSVLIGEIRLRRLDVSGTQLLVRRDAQGHVHIGGIDMDRQTDHEDSAAADWFIKQRGVALHDGIVVWHDEMRGAPPIRFEQVNLLLENRGSRHRFGLTANPPSELAAPIDVRGEVTLDSIADIAKAPGRVYLRLDYADVAAWKPWLPLPIDLKSGRGAVRGWVEFAAGDVHDLTMDVELDDVRSRLKANLPELDLSHLAGRIEWRQQGDQTDFGTRSLVLTTKGGIKLAPGDVTMKHVAKVGERPAKGEIKSSKLQLEPLFALVQFMPVDDNVRARLAKFAPVGALERGSFAWTGPFDAPVDYEMGAQFRGLGVNAVESFPGMTRMTGSIEANGRGGSVNLTADRSRLALPRYYSAPIELDALGLQASWKISDQITVKVSKLTFSNADTAGSAQGEYRTLDKGPGHIDVTGSLSRGKGAQVHKYLPLAIAPSVRNWLRDAITSGDLTEAKFVVKGNLFEFPFAADRGGVFQITGKVVDGAINYADQWPPFTAIKADLLFHGTKMDVQSSDATTVGVRLSRVHVEIPDMAAIPTRLLIQGEATDNTEDFLQYVEKSPVGNWIGHVTREAKVTGNGKLNLGIEIPLGHGDETKVTGEYTFAGNVIQLRPDTPRLDKAAGRFTFSEREFRARDVSADALGGAALIQVGVTGGKTRISAAGNADIAEVRKLYPFPLADQLRGRTDWQFTLQSDGVVTGWTVESGMRGITSELPPPLAKKPEQPLALRVERQPIDATHDRLIASFGTVGNFEAVRVLNDKGGDIQRLAFGFGKTPARADRDGFWIRGSVDNIELEPWLAIAAGGASAAAPTISAPATMATGDKATGALELTGIDLQAETLLAFGRRFRDIHTQVRTQPGGWRIEIDSADIAGSGTWQPAKSGDSGKLTARLRRLSLPSEPAAPAGSTPVAHNTRRELPALDIVADSYVSRGRDLGRLELAARPEGADWRVDTLALRNPEGDITGTGRWRVQGNVQRTDLDVKLEVRDAGQFLARHGVPEGVKGGSGALSGQFNWIGGPHDFDYPTLNGKFSIEIGRGQFTRVDPGIGKLLGILNLDALARRLRLDFRDVTAQGYAFDELSGDVMVKNGVMTSNNLRIAGPAAKVNIDGEADIARETQRLRIHVQPALSGGLAAAAAAATVNPIIGAGVLLGSTILKDPMGKMFAGDYEVTGTWVNPKVEPMAKGRAQAAASGATQ